jgi:hypothetical protein
MGRSWVVRIAGLSRNAVARWVIAAAFLSAAGLAGAAFLSRAEPSAAQSDGCCFCFNCDDEAPFCVDFMSSSSSCFTQCESAGCTAHTFSQVDTCGGGCGGMPPYASLTPTPTPTPTFVDTPTDTPTVTNSPTPPATPTPFFCCECPLAGGGSTCGERPAATDCNAGCSALENQVCTSAGLCVTRTPTNTPTNTVPTNTATLTRTATLTSTQTPTITPTPEISAFDLDAYSCYRAKGASAAKGLEYDVTDAYGNRKKKIIKPFLECSPANVAGDANPVVNNPNEHLTCYKARDATASQPPDVTVRNHFDPMMLDLDLVRGQLLCMPSLAFFKVPTSAPSQTPTATPTNTP